MKTPKRATVTKRPSAEQIQGAKKWNEFVTMCQVEWDDLTEDWKDLFWTIGSTASSSEEINQSIVKAMGDK